MLDPADEVLIPQPSYVSYVPCTILAGGTPVIIELEEKDQFKPVSYTHLDVYKRQLTYNARTKILRGKTERTQDGKTRDKGRA